jgi:AcrR family transcriptional regulator
MAARHISATKLEIIQVATRMFLERGYSATAIKAISDEINISAGNLTFHFPTKEHLLSVKTEMLCEFQWDMMERAANEGSSSLLAQCLELTSMAAICEESEIGRDFYVSTYTHPLSHDIIRKNDAKRARSVFGEYCGDWPEMNYREAETLVSGIEYATMMKTPGSAPLEVRIAGAINAILLVYGVPEAIREKKIKKVLRTDYRSLGRRLLGEFTEYVNGFDEEALEKVVANLKSYSEQDAVGE